MKIYHWCLSFFLFTMGGFSALPAQFFNEDFSTYADGTTTGAGSSWTSVCPGCASGDFFEVRSGAMTANDVNDFATWETAPINIASCANVFFSLDAIENGDHEGPGCACGINIDYFDVSYSIDGGPFTIVENWNGDGEPGHTLTGDTQNGTFTDADWGATNILVSGLSGNTLTLRVVLRNTAGSEFLILDNVIVDCVLPVELDYFQGESRAGGVDLNWAAAEAANGRFEVQRSANGQQFESIGSVAAVVQPGHTYQFTDGAPLAGDSWYRLRQIDQGGIEQFSHPIQIEGAAVPLRITAPRPNPTSDHLAFDIESTEVQRAVVSLTDLSGRTLREQRLELGNELRAVRMQVGDLPGGMYFLQVRSAQVHSSFRVLVK